MKKTMTTRRLQALVDVANLAVQSHELMAEAIEAAAKETPSPSPQARQEVARLRTDAALVRDAIAIVCARFPQQTSQLVTQPTGASS